MKAIPPPSRMWLLLEPDLFGDRRGFFYESFNARRFAELTGVTPVFVQDNHSKSARNVWRALPKARSAGTILRSASGGRRGCSLCFGEDQQASILADAEVARERGELRIVDGQFGAPAWNRTIADSTALILAQARTGKAGCWNQHGGVDHLSSQGRISWFGFTQAILAAAQIECRLVPVNSEQYLVQAARAGNSVLCSDRLQASFCNFPN